MTRDACAWEAGDSCALESSRKRRASAGWHSGKPADLTAFCPVGSVLRALIQDPFDPGSTIFGRLA